MKDVLQECKTVALKRRKASSRLENLGIPEEELLRQQQELFAKVGTTPKMMLNSLLLLFLTSNATALDCSLYEKYFHDYINMCSLHIAENRCKLY